MAIVLKSNRPSDAADASDAARKVTGLAGFNLEDFADQGRQRLEQCRDQVRQWVEDANREAATIRKQAHDQGYQQGLAKAAVDADKKVKQQAEKLATDSLQRIHQAVQQLHETYQSWMQQYTESLSSIAISAAEKVIKRKLEQDAQILVSWADEAVRSARSATQLTLAVHPETLAHLGQTLDELLASPDLPEQTTVEPDETVAIDAVVIRQVGGEIRAGLDEQLGRLREMLS
ncbi:FliH/SctL family protein [Novipirellula artificiosorum]|uniref:Flagellar assembly protein FliH n=1 Tax=Novipirellula artificiosorum TaxID=2528016 RepID=A0A5C6DWG7_9BACT|nr:FliH/SctL family protein [Novipirellula artificiosorum]TWU41743.1 flagellar assembly protein H [Novipirellula artificiosorum]